jgi:hypothetical protein
VSYFAIKDTRGSRKTSLPERVVDFDGAMLAVLVVDAPLHFVYSLAVQLLLCFLEVNDNLRDVLRVVASDFKRDVLYDFGVQVEKVRPATLQRREAVVRQEQVEFLAERFHL